MLSSVGGREEDCELQFGKRQVTVRALLSLSATVQLTPFGRGGRQAGLQVPMWGVGVLCEAAPLGVQSGPEPGEASAEARFLPRLTASLLVPRTPLLGWLDGSSHAQDTKPPPHPSGSLGPSSGAHG